MSKSRFQFSLFVLLCLPVCFALLFAAFGWRRNSEPEQHCKVIDIRTEQVTQATGNIDFAKGRTFAGGTSIVVATCTDGKHTFELQLISEFEGTRYSGGLPIWFDEEFIITSQADKTHPNFIQLPDGTCIIKIVNEY